MGSKTALPQINIAQAYGSGEGVGAAMAESGLPMGRDATPLWLAKVQQYAGGAVWLCYSTASRQG